MQSVDGDSILAACQQVQALDLNDNLPDKGKEEKPAVTGSGDAIPAAPAADPSADRTTATTPTPTSTANGLPDFSALGLRPEVVKALSEFGLEDVTKEQQVAIRSFTEKPETVTLLESGTERAITFVAKAAMMQDLDPETLEHQLLILTATRLAGLQVTRVVRALGDGTGLRVRACIGGSPLAQDIRTLRSGVQIVIGTTGRVIDLLERCILNTSYFKTLVLENADEMLTDHRYEVYQILKRLPDSVRVVLLSSVPQTTDVVQTMKSLMTATPEEMEQFKTRNHSQERPRSVSRNGQRRDQRGQKRQLKRRRQSGGSSTDRTEEKVTTPESTATTPNTDEADAAPVVVQPEVPAVVAASA